MMGSARYEGGGHLEFKKLALEKGRKMHRYAVINAKFKTKIGIIHWRGGWRQYVYQADPEIDMSRSCMKELIEFMDSLMEKWNLSRKKGEGVK